MKHFNILDLTDHEGPGVPPFIQTDGGRKAAGFRGDAGDSACRAIAITP